MGIFSKLFGKSNLESKMNIFWETIKSFESNYSIPAYTMMQGHIKLKVKGQERKLEEIFKETDPKIFALSLVANTCGDFCESGEFHIYRGMLNPTGEDFLEMFKDAVKQLILLGGTDEEWYEQNLTALLKNISSVG